MVYVVVFQVVIFLLTKRKLNPFTLIKPTNMQTKVTENGPNAELLTLAVNTKLSHVRNGHVRSHAFMLLSMIQRIKLNARMHAMLRLSG